MGSVQQFGQPSRNIQHPNKSDGFIFFSPMLFKFFSPHNPLWIYFSLAKVRLTQDVAQGLPGPNPTKMVGVTWGYQTRSNHPSPQFSVAPWVWAEFHEVFDQRLRLSHLWKEPFLDKSSSRKKSSNFLWLTFLCQTFLYRLHQILWKNMQCQTFWEAWWKCNQWLKSGKLDWQLESHPKKKPHANLWRSPCALRCLWKKNLGGQWFSSKPTQYCRVVFTWFYYP